MISDYKTLARTISLVENEAPGYQEILQELQPAAIPLIGLTGPPGAGKSTLLNAILTHLLDEGKRIGVVLIDPSSPFNFGALLGDRLRMTTLFNHPNLYTRSLASRGALGGLSDKIIEITEVMRSYPFDYIFVETVGVGQSEVEIAGLADLTVVVLVPEAGDAVQAMKAGMMEIADLFVVNKSDRADADAMVMNLQHQLQMSGREHIPVLKTTAVEGLGVVALIQKIQDLHAYQQSRERKIQLMAEKCLRIIQRQRMIGFNKNELIAALQQSLPESGFNLYRFVSRFLNKK